MTEEKKTEEQSSEEEKTEDTKNEDKKVEDTKESSIKDSCCSSESGEGCTKDKNVFVWLIVIVLIIGVVIFVSQRNSDSGEPKAVNEKTSEEVKTAALELIEGNLVAPGTSVEVGAITEESGLYKIELTVEGQEVTSYMTKDKTKFIPQLIEAEELNTQEGDEDKTEQQTNAPVTEVTTKSDKPEIELFVMSHCPYGTQMEKGILPVLDTLGKSVDMKFKFVDYAMHGEKEVKEQMRQYCIQETTPNKFQDYLGCFLSGASGDEVEAKACMTKLQINSAVVAQCEKTIDEKYNILALLKDKASWVSGQFPQFNTDKEDGDKYGVQGSPTLVINGEQVQSGRDSASLLAVICSAFNEPPAACDEVLSTTAPAPGFGTGVDTTGASAAADCGV